MDKYQFKTNFHVKRHWPLKYLEKKFTWTNSSAIYMDFRHFYKITIFWKSTPKLAETNAKWLETRTEVSNSLDRFLCHLLFDVTPITSREGLISVPKCVDFYTKMKLVHRIHEVHHSCTYLLNFTITENSLNFVNNLSKIFPEMQPKQ